MTSAEHDSHAQPQGRTDRLGLAAFMAVLAAMSRLVQDFKELPVPWTTGFSCNVRSRAELERLHELYGGTLHETWLHLGPEMLEPYLSPAGRHLREEMYLSMSVHIRDEEEAPL